MSNGKGRDRRGRPIIERILEVSQKNIKKITDSVSGNLSEEDKAFLFKKMETEANAGSRVYQYVLYRYRIYKQMGLSENDSISKAFSEMSDNDAKDVIRRASRRGKDAERTAELFNKYREEMKRLGKEAKRKREKREEDKRELEEWADRGTVRRVQADLVRGKTVEEMYRESMAKQARHARGAREARKMEENFRKEAEEQEKRNKQLVKRMEEIGYKKQKRYARKTRPQTIPHGLGDFFDQADREYEAAEDGRVRERERRGRGRIRGFLGPLATGTAWGGRRIKYKIFEIMILAVGVILSMTLPPFFGLPTANFLAIALALAVPYIVLPTEDDLRRGLLEGRDKEQQDKIDAINKRVAALENLLWGRGLDPNSGEYKTLLDRIKFEQSRLQAFSISKTPQFRGVVGGPLAIKTFFKILIYSSVIWQFFTINRFAAIIVAFILYFMLPTRYRTDQPHKMFEAWFRMVLAIFMAYLFWVTFAGTSVGASLGLMAAAFFFTFPITSQAPDDINEMHFTGVLGKRANSLDKIMFFLLMAFAYGFSGAFFGLMEWFGTTWWIFSGFWLISLISGWGAGPESRPALGVMMMIVALFAFSTTFTGVMGQAVFGYWWPQVYAVSETVGDVVGPAWEQITAGIGETWTLMTNPAAYYEMMMRRQQASTTMLESGGSPLSIEMSRFEIFTSVMRILDPQLDSIVGTIELENMGEFNAENIKAEIWAEWTDISSKTMESAITGTIIEIECSAPSTPGGKGTDIVTCDWTEETVPDEIRFLSFVFEKGGEDEGSGPWVIPDGNLNDLKEPEELEESEEIVLIDTFEHAAEMVKIKLNFTYDYDVNVSIAVEVIDNQLYEDLLKAREITLQELISKYTGGPAKATLWSQRQPIRDKERTLFVASLYNDGSGDIIEIKSFKVLIPLDLIGNKDNVEIISHTFVTCDFEDPIIGKYLEIKCSSNKHLEPTQFRRVSFFLQPVEIEQKIRKTSNIVGLAEYVYEKTESEMLTIANTPMG